MRSLSLRSALEHYVIPLRSAQQLAHRYVRPQPVSLRWLLGASDLVPESRTFHFPLDRSTVSGWTDMTISADGTLAFSGHLHESGALSHHYYLFCVIDVRIEPGLPLIVAHGGYVDGTLGFGSRDSDWDIPAHREHQEVLAALWFQVTNNPQNYCDFEVTTGVIEFTEALAAVAVASGIVMGAEQLASRVIQL